MPAGGDVVGLERRVVGVALQAHLRRVRREVAAQHRLDPVAGVVDRDGSAPGLPTMSRFR